MVKIILLDIEGTVCSISFVKDVLFPYALAALDSAVSSEWDSVEFASYRHAFPSEFGSSPSALASHVRDLIQQDVKIGYLKSLQGYLWKRGYAAGLIKAPLFPDVIPALTSLVNNGSQLMIYSSGSVAAQKLLFGHTTGGDLTRLITDYFDTVNAGPKTEASSYAKIVAAHADKATAASEWLFLSDNVLEVEAAKAAGMHSYIVTRPGNAELAADARLMHKVIENFEGLVEMIWKAG